MQCDSASTLGLRAAGRHGSVRRIVMFSASSVCNTDLKGQHLMGKCKVGKDAAAATDVSETAFPSVPAAVSSMAGARQRRFKLAYEPE